MFSKWLSRIKEGNKKESLKSKKPDFLSDGANRFFLVLGVVSNVVSWLLVVSKMLDLPEPIILHYNAYFGIDMPGPKKLAFLYPSAGLIIILVNFFLGMHLSKKDLIASRLIAATSLLFNLLVNTAIAALIYVNRI